MRGRVPLAAAVVLCASLVAVPGARGGEEVGSEGPVSVLGRGVLGRSDLVVRGRVGRVAALPGGTRLATLDAVETLAGRAPEGGRVQVLSTEEGYFARWTGEAAFFLRRLPGGARHECLAVMDLSDGAGPARLAALRRVIDVESLPAARRAGALRTVCLEGLAASDAWTRQNAARETAHLAALRPEAFTVADLADLRRRASGEADGLLRPLLVEAVEALHAAARAGRLGAATGGEGLTLRGAALLRALREAATPEERRRALETVRADDGPAALDAVLGALSGDPDAGVRAAAAAALVRMGSSPRSSEALVRSLRAEWDDDVRVAAAEALGELGVADAVPALAEAARRGGAIERVALFALARIRTKEAVAALRGFLPAATAPVTEPATAADAARLEADRARRALVEFLISDAFLRQEEVLRRVRADAAAR